MSEKSLRSKIIRLAHQQPELREHLLPLIAEKTATEIDRGLVKEIESMGTAYSLGYSFAKKVSYKGKNSTQYWFGSDILFYGLSTVSLIIDVVEDGQYIVGADIGEINRRYQVSNNLKDFLFSVKRSIEDLDDQSAKHNDFYEG